LLSISPVHIWYSAEARPYAGMMCFLLLALLAVFEAAGAGSVECKSARRLVCLYFFSLLLGTLSHLYMAVPARVPVWYQRLHRKRALTFLALNASSCCSLPVSSGTSIDSLARFPLSDLFTAVLTVGGVASVFQLVCHRQYSCPDRSRYRWLARPALCKSVVPIVLLCALRERACDRSSRPHCE
jgi:hypothetical protein